MGSLAIVQNFKEKNSPNLGFRVSKGKLITRV
jgi:hypothetical protein